MDQNIDIYTCLLSMCGNCGRDVELFKDLFWLNCIIGNISQCKEQSQIIAGIDYNHRKCGCLKLIGENNEYNDERFGIYTCSQRLNRYIKLKPHQRKRFAITHMCNDIKKKVKVNNNENNNNNNKKKKIKNKNKNNNHSIAMRKVDKRECQHINDNNPNKLNQLIVKASFQDMNVEQQSNLLCHVMQPRYMSIIGNILMLKQCNWEYCQTKGVTLKRCRKCRSVYYCSKLCQKKDWQISVPGKDRHKFVCQKLTQRKYSITIKQV